ncbi:MAG: ATP-binding protein, partial [candidate division WOR-3 bacterium]
WARREFRAEVWPGIGRRQRPTLSWLGVPMMVGGRVIGMISIQSLEQEHAFDQGDKELLSTVANQAAVAIENARLYANMEQMVAERTQAWLEERERADAAEKLALMSDVAAEFAHRMSNLAGTIPVRVEMAREMLDPRNARDARVIRELDSIGSDAKLLLDAAQEIKKTTEVKAPELVDVNAELEIARGRVWASKPEAEGRIQVRMDLSAGLPPLYVERNKLVDTLVSVIQNGVEAMPEGGTLTLTTRQGTIGNKPCVEIVVADTGEGIPAEHLPKIFDLFFTTKEKGLGFGLWRDRLFVKNLGGDIEVNSEVGEGTTFTIRIPVPADAAIRG